MNVFKELLALVKGEIEHLSEAGELPGGLDVTGVLVEPPRDPQHGDMATNAAMVLAKRASKAPPCWPGGWPAAMVSRRSMSPGRASSICASKRLSGTKRWRALSPRVSVTAPSIWGAEKRSTSNSSRPTRPGRSMSATAAAPCSATSWRRSLSAPAMTSRGNITSTMPAPRSMRWRARCISATSKRSGASSPPTPSKTAIREIIWFPSARHWRASMAINMPRRQRANGSKPSAPSPPSR